MSEENIDLEFLKKFKTPWVVLFVIIVGILCIVILLLANEKVKKTEICRELAGTEEAIYTKQEGVPACCYATYLDVGVDHDDNLRVGEQHATNKRIDCKPFKDMMEEWQDG